MVRGYQYRRIADGRELPVGFAAETADRAVNREAAVGEAQRDRAERRSLDDRHRLPDPVKACDRVPFCLLRTARLEIHESSHR